MTDLLATLNNPKAEEQNKSWEAEVAKAEAELKPAEEKPSEGDVSHETKPAEETTNRVNETAKEIQEVLTAKTEEAEERKVPLKALQEEREARQSLERKLAELEQRFQQPQRQEEAPQEEQPPDPETDPIGALKYNQKKWAEFQQQQQQQAYANHLLGSYQNSLRTYAAQTPDFMDAYNHALKSRGAELKAYGLSEQEIDASIKQDQLQLAETAIRQGKNPAELIYAFAEARGYQKKAAEQKPAAQKVDPAVQQAKADAAVSLTTGGKPPANELTEEEALRTLKGAALDSWIEKRWKAMEAEGGRKSALFRN